MKFYKIIIIFLILMFFSVGFVCAEDVNQDDLQTNASSEILSQDAKSFTDLDYVIHQQGDTNLTADYTFDEEKDNKTSIYINFHGEDYTLNGNNRVIDAKGQTNLFYFLNGTVTINNLVIKNCNSRAITLNGCTFITNNVTFENNFDGSAGAAVCAKDSFYYSNGDKFIDNYAKTGSAIGMFGGGVQINNSVFLSKNPIHWSLIYGENADISVFNSIFNNVSSRYATVAYGDGGTIRVFNSKFRNLYANATGGAIAAKRASVVIIGCEFENVSSAKNGGALYLDINGETDQYINNTVLVTDTVFTNCYSGFGGAVLQLGGCLSILNSEFIKNYALYGGGAVYTSNSSFYVEESIFDSNFIYNATYDLDDGGALYVDFSDDVEIEGCDFINNTAIEGGAIFLYDAKISISGCNFTLNGEAIRAYFAREGSFYRSCDVDLENPDKFILNSTYYPSVVDFKGNEIVLNPIPITGSVDDLYFNLADFNAITPVKDQGTNGACWAFGANGALESALLMATNITLDLSENNIQSAGIRYSIYGRPTLTESGYLYSGLNYYMAWLGAIDTKFDTYDELGKISSIIFTPDNYHILDAVYVDVTNISAVKQALLEYGALTIFVTGANPNSEYYNPATYGLYCNDSEQLNHFVTLVGWNDTFSKDNFILTPEGDGAWICKNSWGTDWADNGFYYLSYYDAPLRDVGIGIAYDISNTVVYNKLYQYDITGYSDFYEADPYASYINYYESVGNDLIAAVGTYFAEAGTPYTLTIKVNGAELYSQMGTSPHKGYQTIQLDRFVCIGEGDEFSVEFQVGNGKIPISADTRLFFEEKSSFIKSGGELADLTLYGAVACLKVYTVEDLNVTSDVVRYYDSKKVEISSDLEGASVSIYQKSKLIASAEVKNGKATFNVKINPGDYSITTSYNNMTIVNYLKVLISFKFLSTATITMDYGGAATCKVQVLDNLGDYAIGKFVYFNINGKTYKTQTKSKGIATFKIPNTVTPGTYKLTARCDDVKITKTVKVRQILKAKSTVSIKKSAKKLTLWAVIKTSAGKVIKGKKVSFKVNGKTLSSKTNSKGVVQVTFNKAFLIKLKVGKSYKIQITYLKDTIKTTLKVKR